MFGGFICAKLALLYSSFRFTLPVQLVFTATKPGYLMDVVNATISGGHSIHIIGISLSPELEEGEQYLRLVMNWGVRPMDLDLHSLQIEK